MPAQTQLICTSLSCKKKPFHTSCLNPLKRQLHHMSQMQGLQKMWTPKNHLKSHGVVLRKLIHGCGNLSPMFESPPGTPRPVRQSCKGPPQCLLSKSSPRIPRFDLCIWMVLEFTLSKRTYCFKGSKFLRSQPPSRVDVIPPGHTVRAKPTGFMDGAMVMLRSAKASRKSWWVLG